MRHILSVLFMFMAAASIRAEERGCARVPEVARKTASLRGLALRHPIRCRELGEKEVDVRLRAIMDASDPPSKMRYEEQAYKMLGLIPRDFDYSRCLSQGLSQWITAIYDYMLSGEILIPRDREVPDEALAHEITHALEDQHFNLRTLHTKFCKKTDSCLALAALSEGDALVTQAIFEEKFGSAKKQEVSASRSPETDKENTCQFPETLLKQLEFPYSFGRLYVERLVRGGDFRQIDSLFSNPPRASKTILQSNCSVGREDTCASRPPASSSFANDRLVFSDVVGQYTISILLANANELDKALLASKGWHNDALRLFETKPNEYTLTWETRWESTKDAVEFMDSLKRLLGRRFEMALDPETLYLCFTSFNGANVQVESEDKTVRFTIREPRSLHRYDAK